MLERERLPLSTALLAFAAMEKLDPVDLALSGGDDYELFFTVPARNAARLDATAAALGSPITRIGRVEPGTGAALSGPGGDRNIEDLGHDHLGRPR